MIIATIPVAKMSTILFNLNLNSETALTVHILSCPSLIVNNRACCVNTNISVDIVFNGREEVTDMQFMDD